MAFTQTTIVHDAIGAEDANTMTPRSWPSKLLPLFDWYGADAITWRSSPSAPLRSISRERLVKRVANVLGASHPMKSDPMQYSEDDVAIAEFMKIEVAERPLPYYVIMSICQEILRSAGMQEPNVKQPAV